MIMKTVLVIICAVLCIAGVVYGVKREIRIWAVKSCSCEKVR